MKSFGKPVDILTRLNEMAGYAPEEDIELYEVCCLNIRSNFEPYIFFLILYSCFSP